MNKNNIKNKLVHYGVFAGVGAFLGALSTYILFLPPSVTGMIVPLIGFTLLVTIVKVAEMLEFTEIQDDDQVRKDDKKHITDTDIGVYLLTATVAGAGLGTAANFFFPGVMLSMGYAALACAAIGVIANLTADTTRLIANQYITNPLVEKHCPSKEIE
ncbi:MAG: hypothetical protein QWI36_00280 [Wolbachia endosymbiont of Tyrophagus putrescentiae]|nr:hypothetical protein [Wolbachia endosymbiont of Tyrophagus putrescentiae]